MADNASVHFVKLQEYFSQHPAIPLKEGESLLQPGDQLSQVYFIDHGFIRQYVVSAEGVELTHHLYKPGSFFPLLLSLNDTENRFFFDAFTDAVLRPAPMTEVIPFLKNHPDLLIDLNQRLLAGLNGLLHRLEAISFGSAATRVANSLLYLAKHFGQEDGDVLLITQPFTHKNLSHIAGLTRETTSLELEKLIEKGVLRREKNNYIILNRLELENIATF